MNQYLQLMHDVKENGIVKGDRTGTGTRSLFGYQMRFNLRDGFPLMTTKKLHLKSIVHELIWFLNGSTNIKYLQDNGVTIWNDWADENGDLGPVYGAQWRSWPAGDEIISTGIGDLVQPKTIDQISNVLHQIKTNPDSRRLIVSAWNPAQVDEMKLPPCHALFQFYTREMTSQQRVNWAHANEVDFTDILAVGEGITDELLDNLDVPKRYLDCQLYQRSADIFLGVPFNIASYALLTHMMAHQTGMVAGDFIWTGGDCHLYSNHMDQVEIQLNRKPKALPKLVFKRKPDSIFDYKFEDFEFEGYDPHPLIKAPVAV